MTFISPQTYQYIRQKFNNNLPHSATIRKWFSNSSVDGEPGICNGSIALIRNIVDEQKLNNKLLYCTVAFDEMSIRQHIQWIRSQKKFYGFINFGSAAKDAEHLPIANEVLVFMVIGINYNFSLPVAYYFTDKLNGVEKMVLFTAISKAVTDVGVEILAKAFDGFPSNIVSCEMQGASFDLANLQPFVKNSHNGSKIFVSMDPPHMLKLVRSSLAHHKIFIDRNGNEINWKFFENLVELGKEEDFVTHKMTREHLDLNRNSMNVLYAVQTLSGSVAKAMKYFRDCNHPKFENCTGTAKFADRINKIFDILNSDTLRVDNKYKSPIMQSTKQSIFDFIDDSIDYLKKLTLQGGLPIIESCRKVGFKGLIVDLTNIKNIYCEYVETKKLEFLPARKMNQDPVENLFGRIRTSSALGNNTNPTAQQFRAAFRRVLVDNEIKTSKSANCEDKLDFLFVSSCKSSNKNSNSLPNATTVNLEHEPIVTQNEPQNNNDEYQQQCDILMDILIENLDDNKRIGLAYMAGVIDKKITMNAAFHCDKCKNILVDDDKIILNSFPKNKTTQIPCISTFEICLWAYDNLKPALKSMDFNYFTLIDKILQKDMSRFYSKTDFSEHEEHKAIFVKFIVEEFINMQATYTAKKVTLMVQENNNKKKANKVEHFLGQ